MRKDLDQDTKRAEGVLRLHDLRDLLERRNDLVIHGGFLHSDTDIYAELIAQHLRLNMITGSGNNSVIEHLLNTLVNRCAADSTLLCYILEGNTRRLSNSSIFSI